MAADDDATAELNHAARQIMEARTWANEYPVEDTEAEAAAISLIKRNLHAYIERKRDVG